MNGGETANGRRETRQRRKTLFDLSALLRLTSSRFSAVKRETGDGRRGNGMNGGETANGRRETRQRRKTLFDLSHLLRLTSYRFKDAFRFVSPFTSYVLPLYVSRLPASRWNQNPASLGGMGSTVHAMRSARRVRRSSLMAVASGSFHRLRVSVGSVSRS